MAKRKPKHKPADQKTRADWYAYHKQKGTLKKPKGPKVGKRPKKR